MTTTEAHRRRQKWTAFLAFLACVNGYSLYRMEQLSSKVVHNSSTIIKIGESISSTCASRAARAEVAREAFRRSLSAEDMKWYNQNNPPIPCAGDTNHD